MSNYELYHHGIKGQRWGVRRYQNPDGSLKDAGRKRYVTSTLRRNERRYGEENSLRQINKEKYETYTKKSNKAKTAGKVEKANKLQTKAKKYEKLMNTSIKEMEAAQKANKKTVDTAIKAGYDVKVNSKKGIYYSKRALREQALTYAIAGWVPAAGMNYRHALDKTGKYSTRINAYQVKSDHNLVGPDGELSRKGKKRLNKIENKDYRNEMGQAKRTTRAYYLDKIGLIDSYKYYDSNRYKNKVNKYHEKGKEIGQEYKQFREDVKKEKAKRGIK